MQETRGWNAELARGYVLRDKEDAHNYRYFPDPDIPTLGPARRRLWVAMSPRVFEQVSNAGWSQVQPWVRDYL